MRPVPEDYLIEKAEEVLGSDDVYAVVQAQRRKAAGGHELRFPAVVVSAVGHDTLTTLDGPFETATVLRFDVRGKAQNEVRRLSAAIVAALRAGGRLRSLLSLTDLYDDELSIHRRVRSVMVR